MNMFVEQKLRKKKLPMASDVFEKVDYIDEEGNVHQQKPEEKSK